MMTTSLLFLWQPTLITLLTELAVSLENYLDDQDVAIIHRHDDTPPVNQLPNQIL